MSKAWQVGPYHDDWVIIVHADTRGQARKMGCLLDFSEFVEMRATRLAKLDGETITQETLRAARFPESTEGRVSSASDYLLVCTCDLCRESLRLESMNVISA